MGTSARRMPFVDLLKAFASQLIVLHHLAFYGPMSDIAHPIAGPLIDALYQYGRMAVQIFLVTAGYLAIRSFAPAGTALSHQSPWSQISSRYRRLVLPLMAALLISVFCANLARHLIEHPSIPSAPGTWQLIAHALLLQNLLGVEALSAGVWYIAIDFQLFALLALGMWLSTYTHKRSLTVPLAITLLGAAALFYFNRNAAWNNTALYFAGSYSLGIAAAWASQASRIARWSLVIALIAVLALIIDFRLRIAIALLTAISLGLGDRNRWFDKLPAFPISAWLSRISYSLFLIHFPICLLVNAVVSRLAPNSPVVNLMGMGLAWLLSIGAAQLFHHTVELPCGRLMPRRKTQTARIQAPA